MEGDLSVSKADDICNQRGKSPESLRGSIEFVIKIKQRLAFPLATSS